MKNATARGTQFRSRGRRGQSRDGDIQDHPYTMAISRITHTPLTIDLTPAVYSYLVTLGGAGQLRALDVTDSINAFDGGFGF